MLVFEAAKERALLPLIYIAQCAHKVEPDNPFWKRLLREIEEGKAASTAEFPVRLPVS